MGGVLTITWSSTPFPFFRIRKFSKIWERPKISLSLQKLKFGSTLVVNGFESSPRAKQFARLSPLRKSRFHKRIFKNGDERNFDHYMVSTPFPFFRIRKFSKIWEKGFESSTESTQVLSSSPLIKYTPFSVILIGRR